MKHCSTCHRVVVGTYRVDSYTYYRPPWDSSSKLYVFRGCVKRVATNRLLSQSRLPRAHCSPATRCSRATWRRHCAPPFDSAETVSKRLQLFLSILLLQERWLRLFVACSAGTSNSSGTGTTTSNADWKPSIRCARKILATSSGESARASIGNPLWRE